MLVQVSDVLLGVGVGTVLDLLWVVVGFVQYEWRVVLDLAMQVVELVVLGLMLQERLELLQVLEYLDLFPFLVGDGSDLWGLIFLCHFAGWSCCGSKLCI